MAPRKPKQPERRKVPAKRASAAAPAYGVARGLGRAVLNHPLPIAGATSFVVAFSFVAANAVWYQPHAHPAPSSRRAASRRRRPPSSNRAT